MAVDGAGWSPARIATLTAIAVALGLGLSQAFLAAPGHGKDELAHTGYLVALADGRLPTLDTPIEVPEGADDLGTAFDRMVAENVAAGRDDRDLVWVANHPPGAYLPALPGAWVARVTGQGEAALISLRLTNVLGMGLAVGLTALLAREITGSGVAGAVAAGVMAAVPHLGATTALGMTDGLTLAAVVGVVWAVTRAVGRDFDRGATAVVAGFAVACGATRISALATALAVVGLGLAVVSVRRGRIVWAAAGAIAGAVAAACGWFYLRNAVLYGDPAGSSMLLERYDRSPNGSLLDVMLDGHLWTLVARTLAASRFANVVAGVPVVRGLDGPASMAALVAVALAAAVVGRSLWRGDPTPLARRRVAQGAHRGRAPRPVGWALLATAVFANWVAAAQHVAGGGLAHPRYLMVAIPAAACAVAAACTRLAAGLRGPGAARRAGLALSVPVAAVLLYNLAGAPEAVDRLRHTDAVGGAVSLGPGWSIVIPLAMTVVAAWLLLRALGRCGAALVAPTSAAQGDAWEGAGVLAGLDRDLAVDHRQVVAGGALHPPTGTAGEVVAELGDR